MDLATWINPIYAVLAWVIMIFSIDKERIKQLAPIGLLAVILLFISQGVTISLGLTKYLKGLVLVMGIPLFQFFWAFAYAILLISFVKEEWAKKIPVIVVFSLINEFLVYIAIRVGNLQFANGYTYWHDLVLTLVFYSFGVWLSEGLFKKQIYEL